MSLTQQFKRGFLTIDAVQLAPENGGQVWEWADSKPFYSPERDRNGQLILTGLAVFTPTGRVKAEFGDWIYQTPGGDFKVYSDGEFRELFAEVAS